MNKHQQQALIARLERNRELLGIKDTPPPDEVDQHLTSLLHFRPQSNK